MLFDVERITSKIELRSNSIALLGRNVEVQPRCGGDTGGTCHDGKLLPLARGNVN